MQLNPYLSFDGQCEAAFKFYEQCLGGKINAVMHYGKSPMAEQVPPNWQSKVIHACLTVGDMELMGSDAMPEYFEKPQGFSINLQFNDVTKAEQIFDALAAGGTVRMQLQETFWAKRFGTVVDQFGTPWMINCD
ncbi:VOC family protein [Rivularia sp. UHCC 0363]|uniref:VOC family protein n=1 Tax=Rivularia sp. UHCC 0363 TaxID=3110244 RepID=UPI002B204F03|nr:VOC family protein [Rivularia sp. UHCC 0363]MEA5599086.1 VOC family protein [Rivularia sp. UHCC 0363]